MRFLTSTIKGIPAAKWLALAIVCLAPPASLAQQQDYDAVKEQLRQRTQSNAEAAQRERDERDAELAQRREAARLRAESQRAWEAEASRDLVPVSHPEPSAQIQWDYPSRAIRDALEGQTTIVVTVEPNGIPSDCTITQSSGHAILDEAACRQAASSRQRYGPALNSYGYPVRGFWEETVNWRLN